MTQKPANKISKTKLSYRVIWYTKIRWLFIAIILLPSLALRLLFKNPYSALKPTLIITLVACLYNGALWLLVQKPRSVKELKTSALYQLAFDLIGITLLVLRGGGIDSRASILYTIPILASGIIFQSSALFITAGVALVLYGSTISAAYYHLISVTSTVHYDPRQFITLAVFNASALIIVSLLGGYFIDLIGLDSLKYKKQKNLTARLLRQNQLSSENFSQRTQALFNSIGDGLIVVNEYGNISEVNQAALNILGFSRKDLIDKWFPKAIISVDQNGEVVPPFKRPSVIALETGKVTKADSFYLDKAQVVVPVSQIASPFLINGTPAGGIIAFRDIRDELELQKAKDDFVSLASHQLRTPATAVKNFIGLLKEGYAGKLTTEQKNFVDNAYESNERQLQVIDELLQVARTESGQIKLKLEQANATDLLAAVVNEQLPVIKGRKQVVEMDLPKKAVVGTFDKEYFRMVIENLLSNASKYTPEGGKITLRLDENRNGLSLSVQDTGVGIAKSEWDKLFKKFSRTENPMVQSVTGSGVGLYLVKQIMDLHRGRIEVKSKQDHGSVFRAVLPKVK